MKDGGKAREVCSESSEARQNATHSGSLELTAATPHGEEERRTRAQGERMRCMYFVALNEQDCQYLKPP